MALTINVENVEQLGNTKFLYGTVTWDSSYPTGGEAFAVTAPEKVESISVVHAQGKGLVTGWDAANQKLIAYYADYDAVADGVLIQVPNTTDLSAHTQTFFAVGQ